MSSGLDEEVFDCPHCGIRSLQRLHPACRGAGITYSTYAGPTKDEPARWLEMIHQHLIYTCVNCGGDTYFLRVIDKGYMADGKDYRSATRMRSIRLEPRPEHQFPVPTPSRHRAVPSIVQTATIEAEKCLAVSAYNASAVMVRRALEALCMHKGAKGEDLYQKLQDLRNKHEITPDLWSWADDLRVLGRSGAHADWEDVKAEDADYGVRFLHEILRYVYINPSEREEKRLREGLKRRAASSEEPSASNESAGNEAKPSAVKPKGLPGA